jgi:hypothetical protein
MNEKSASTLVSPDKALGPSVKSFFDFIGWTEAT